jgi:hypothetical protein
MNAICRAGTLGCRARIGASALARSVHQAVPLTAALSARFVVG